ncbi:CoA-transferase [Saccharomonospora sp. NPDC046836]|uniref:CoA-transferase n=1 Tax=Saccharomonospora sp. NPDC046836 TaxID=3156921 RepID=UPI0033FCE242
MVLSRKDKRRSLEDAVAEHVRPGMTLHLPFGDARPNALLREVVRQFRGTRPGFTVISTGLLNSQQALVSSGLVTKLITTFAGENYPTPGPSPVIKRALEDGMEIEDWSIYTMVAALTAGALGVPFYPVRSFAEGSMSGRAGMAPRATVDNPFAGGEVTVVPALVPDLTLLHGVAGDAEGNIVMAGPGGEREWGALASRVGVLATVERIVERDVIEAHNSQVRLPAPAVLTISEVSGGSAPYGTYTAGIGSIAGYDEDVSAMLAARQSMRTANEFDSWVDKWLVGNPAGQLDAPSVPQPETYTDAELMIVAAARRIATRIEAAGFDFVLAGIGQANLAAWLAHATLAPARAPMLLAEMGMVGYTPQPGDPYLFANRNKPSAAQLTDTTAILGAYVGHHRMRTLAAVGAGQLAADGSINSTVGHDGAYLTGSGGVNDIASVADELVVILRQSARRLLDDVEVRTAPGRAVRTVVTDRAIFVRDGDRFRLEAVLVPPARSAASTDELLADVRARTGWSGVEWPADPIREPLPTISELETLRAFDPDRHFLR